MAAPEPLVALVTAGSAGVGAATARLFAASGFRVAINYSTNAERATELVTALAAVSPLPAVPGRTDFVAIRADLGRRAEVARLVDETLRTMGGRLDVVFSNGGWTRVRQIAVLEDNLDEDDWDRCFNMNVKSHLWLMAAAKPSLEAAEGAFVTMASMAGLTVSGSSMPYAVTKAAQIHLVKALAVAAAPKVRVNSVSPSLMLTDWGLQFPLELQRAAVERTKLKRLVTVEDVAEQVLAFVKCKSITGTNAIIDAGFSL